MSETDVNKYIKGVLGKDRLMLSKVITLAESSLPAHQQLVQKIISSLLPHTGKSVRIAVSGIPGAGKSTFIESFGLMLVEKGFSVGVLTVDPSSSVTGGSILGDKFRMNQLASSEQAYIRSSPSRNNLGGVAYNTKETILLCEAAGFDVVIVETVGVGQSETTVASMVDFYLVLMVAGAGDEIQGIKRGIIELADAIVVNKADGNNIHQALATKSEYEKALSIISHRYENWKPKVLACSAIEKTGIDEVWDVILDHKKALTDSGEFEENRKQQSVKWMYSMLETKLKNQFYNNPDIAKELPLLKKKVEEKEILPATAAEKLIGLFFDV